MIAYSKLLMAGTVVASSRSSSVISVPKIKLPLMIFVAMNPGVPSTCILI